MFNLEISQSGSYVPAHGILNWATSKMVWVKLWYWNFEQLTFEQLLQLHHHPYSADLHAFDVEVPFSFV